MSAAPVAFEEGHWTVPGTRRRLSYRFWRSRPPRGLLVIIHGFGEHGGRYAPMAEALAREGVCVAAPDLWGHGRSGGARGDIGSVSRCVTDVSLLTAQVFVPQSGLDSFTPSHGSSGTGFTVYGHSFGGLVAIALALARPAHLRRLILQSPLLEVGFPVPLWKTTLAWLLARAWPSFTQAINLDPTALSRDQTVGHAYQADPLVHNRMSAGSYASILEARNEAFARVGTLRMPLLLLYGTGDRVVSLEVLKRWFALVPGEKRSVAFPGAYHELHHESDDVREEVLRLLREWTLEGASC